MKFARRYQAEQALSATVRNEVADLLCVYLEPWGGDYWIKRGETLRFSGAGKHGDSVEYVSHDGGVSLWLGSASDVRVAHDDGSVAHVGDQRPEGWPASSEGD